MASRPAAAALLLAFGLGMADRAAADEAPAVVVSIKPIHSLVAGVMDGVGTPTLLIQGAGSPHSYALRPSEARALDEADVVFWVGDGLEAFLARPLAALSGDARVVALEHAKGVRLLPTRTVGSWADHGEDEHAHGHDDDHDEHAHADEHEHEHAHDHEHEHEHAHADEHEDEHAEVHEAGHGHDHGAVDLHLWLDPQNAAAMVETIAGELRAADPAHAAVYEANAEKLRADLARLDAELAETLAPVHDRPFVVFHDAYQYFEDRYGLAAVGAIAVDPQRAPGAARLRDIRAELQERDAACVFAEPQFRPALVETVVEGTGAGTGVLDPLGADLEAGPDQYAELLRSLARSLADCLGTPRSG